MLSNRNELDGFSKSRQNYKKILKKENKNIVCAHCKSSETHIMGEKHYRCDLCGKSFVGE